jgi:hypothetical protein
METLAQVVKAFQSEKATKSGEHLPLLQAILAPVTQDTGIGKLYLSNATAHKIDCLCEVNSVLWSVRLLPTFHGLEVKIHGKDYKDSKALISKVFREAFPLGGTNVNHA